MKKVIILSGLSFVFVLTSPLLSYANVNMLKAYREVNPELKADCTYCHLDKAPKKEQGKHELNPYGTKIKEMVEAEKKEKSDEELKALYISIYKQLGRHDAFKADAATGNSSEKK